MEEIWLAFQSLRYNHSLLKWKEFVCLTQLTRKPWNAPQSLSNSAPGWRARATLNGLVLSTQVCQLRAAWCGFSLCFATSAATAASPPYRQPLLSPSQILPHVVFLQTFNSFYYCNMPMTKKTTDQCWNMKSKKCKTLPWSYTALRNVQAEEGTTAMTWANETVAHGKA